MTKPVVNIDEIPLVPRPAAHMPKGDSAVLYGMSMGRITPMVGAQQLGYNVTAVPPGKRAFPYHSHRVNEEMFFILAGTGEVRIGDRTYPLRRGDIVAWRGQVTVLRQFWRQCRGRSRASDRRSHRTIA